MSHCPSCYDSAICPGTDDSLSADFEKERFNIVVKQCCDLIDEKRTLQKQFDELYCKHIHDLQVVHRLAKFHDEACIAAADIIHVANNFDSFASPLQQIRDRMKSLLISPWHQENIVDKVKEYMNDRTKVPVFESTLCPGEDLRGCSAPNPSDDCAALRGPVDRVVGQSICPICNKPIEEGNMSSTGYIDYHNECNLLKQKEQ